MKNLMIILFVVAAMFACNPAGAQTVSIGTLNPDNTYYEITTDYTLTNTTARNFTVTWPQHTMCAQDFIVNLDSASGNHTNVAVALYGRKSDQTATWTQIGSTVNWNGNLNGGAGVDTTIIISNTTENGYREYKWTFTGTGTGTSTISNMELKLYRGIP